LQGLKDAGHIYAGKFEGPYCIGCEEFKLPGDLDKGMCKIHSKPVEMLSEDNWFFKLSAFVGHYLNTTNQILVHVSQLLLAMRLFHF